MTAEVTPYTLDILFTTFLLFSCVRRLELQGAGRRHMQGCKSVRRRWYSMKLKLDGRNCIVVNKRRNLTVRNGHRMNSDWDEHIYPVNCGARRKAQLKLHEDTPLVVFEVMNSMSLD
jgi:hypothetical protein